MAGTINALRKNTRQQPSKGTYRNCGGDWPHEKGNCPARVQRMQKVWQDKSLRQTMLLVKT
jgi:hypothetical protein